MGWIMSFAPFQEIIALAEKRWGIDRCDELAWHVLSVLRTGDKLHTEVHVSARAYTSVVDHATKHLLRQAGRDLAEGRHIPVCWPDIVTTPMMWDAFMPIGTRKARETESCDFYILSLDIPLVRKT